MNELLDETKKYVTTGEMPANKIFAHPLPLNVIPHIDVFQVRLPHRLLVVLSVFLVYDGRSALVPNTRIIRALRGVGAAWQHALLRVWCSFALVPLGRAA